VYEPSPLEFKVSEEIDEVQERFKIDVEEKIKRKVGSRDIFETNTLDSILV
jgi:hypothetical protein